ncbi:MAG: hypothetical protein ACFHU9_17685 [Fluviicola sp.]
MFIKFLLSLISILCFTGFSYSQWLGESDDAHRSKIYFNGELESIHEKGVKSNMSYIESYESGKKVSCVIELFDNQGRELAYYSFDNSSGEIEVFEKEYKDEERLVNKYETTIKFDFQEGKNPMEVIKKLYKKDAFKEFLDAQTIVSRELKGTFPMDSFGQIDYSSRSTYSGFGMEMMDSVLYEYDADSNVVEETQYAFGVLFRRFKFSYNEHGQIKSKIQFDENWVKKSAINYAYDENGNQIVQETSPARELRVDADNQAHSREIEFSRTEIEYIWNEYRKVYLWATRKTYYEDRKVEDVVYSYDERGTLISYKGNSPSFEYAEFTCKIKYLD